MECFTSGKQMPPVDERHLTELREKIEKAEAGGSYGAEYLLDKLEFVLAESGLRTADELASHIAEQLVEQPDEWERWVSYSDDDYLFWKIVQALVGALRERDPECLQRPPLFGWVVDAALDFRPLRPRGGDKRLKRFNKMVIAVTVNRLRNLPNGPVIWSERGDSACDLVAERLGLQPDTVRKTWLKYKPELRRAGLLGTTPRWMGTGKAE